MIHNKTLNEFAIISSDCSVIYRLGNEGKVPLAFRTSNRSHPYISKMQTFNCTYIHVYLLLQPPMFIYCRMCSRNTAEYCLDC